MGYHSQRSNAQLFVVVCFITSLLVIWRANHRYIELESDGSTQLEDQLNPYFRVSTSVWSQVPDQHPVKGFIALPKGQPKKFPRVQYVFPPESMKSKELREKQRNGVKQVFMKCWYSYRASAWGRDELAPLSGGYRDTFGGWAATLIDSLDTLWIMDLKEEFEEAVETAVSIDFTLPISEEINVFETTIRYLGGFLSAYDLSGDMRLLQKAAEVGELLYKAFDTPNRMPITRWKPQEALVGLPQQAHENALVAEVGSLILEFTRLSQLTGDARWYDAVTRVTKIFEEQQSLTKLPGMWPVVVDGRTANFTKDNGFTLSAMSDSFYEYLPKAFALLGGREPLYRKLYESSMKTAIQHVIFRPMLPDDTSVLMSGNAFVVDGQVETVPEAQHLGCFTGGMFALGGRLLNLPEHVEIGRNLTEGCIWAYRNTPHGIMPEKAMFVACKDRNKCAWNEQQYESEIAKYVDDAGENGPRSAADIIQEYRLPRGYSAIVDRRYILRPEAIESIFVLYRLTGEQRYQDIAWEMFQAIDKATETDMGNAALTDVTYKDEPPLMDSMESFFLAETLKYFYLIFSKPDVLHLDQWVFNTEAHPFRRPV